ncbi:hypothetical protein F5884DRAFT_688047 [Xylogone sp. PMI_703]|nr:hypothetical protein F5884DRAFT_688047 [Xylogone sp. PMI_703]
MLLWLVLCATIAQASDLVKYGAFTVTVTYSIANQLGFFKAYDLDVLYEQVPNSTFAYAEILNGGYDILTGTIDNSVNLRLNSNEKVTVLGQLDQGPELALASIPSITSINQLKGKPLIVDSPVSGYAYLLRKVLETNGLTEGDDYFFQTVGGTNLRYADLVVGQLPNGTTVYATMLLYPFTAEGEGLPSSQRPNVLAPVSDVVNPISSSAFTTRASALTDPKETDLLTRFLGAMYTANLYLHNPHNQKCATAAIRKQLNVSSEVAQLEYTSATNPETGEVSGGNFTVSESGILNIIAVREEFGGFSGLPADFNFTAAVVPGTGKLIDYSIRDAAVVNLKKGLLSRSC